MRSSLELKKEYDVFISHASEDKQSFVEPLTKALKDAGIRTWYDADQIGWGESIRQSIDRGLINSRFCIVVLSTDFFKKHWAGTYELNAIFQRMAIEQNSLILPIWHNITIEEISQYNLTLPDIKALNSSIHTLEQIVNAMKDKIAVEGF
ncbi:MULTISPECIES: toll/interleukin-1 receptor domain-containing protein [Exiguobacterium]|uniref:toll/interleukin-1 receptor domain-containing protein n=1 Tax=Exiguobacterium TaxID=33986 RepID=UPI000690D7E7|nr:MULTISPECIES: toll/interleukin-1 receptor domain-containing protein [Exiguobacterium]